MTTNNSSPTWYDATAAAVSYDVLAGDQEVEICVIGGGLAGITTALELTRAGRSVVLLEANGFASGASGRNGGFVSNGFAEGIGSVEKRVGRQAAQKLYQLSQTGTEYVRRQIAAGDPSIRMGEQWLVMSRHRADDAMRQYTGEMKENYGEGFRFVGRDELHTMVASERYFCGIESKTAFHIHPLKYARMLLRLAAQGGARLHENSPALALDPKGGSFSVQTQGGSVTAKHVVVCVSSLDRRLHRASASAILPVATYIAVTEPLSQDSIRTRAALSDTRRAGDYYRVIDEGRILWGGKITTRVSEPLRLAHKMRDTILSVYPRLGKPKIDYAWAGLMGYALHKMPLIGRDRDGIWFASAFGGHGLNTTAMAGQLIANAIAHGDDAYRRFEAFAPQWAGGPFGRIGVQSSYWWMQLKDRFEER
jgi:gamma-glutamylputrescine oxidase